MQTHLILQGEKIHQALRHFARVSDKDWIRLNLEGGCAVGSYFLFLEGQRVGLPTTFVAGCGHCWVECDDFIYDLTACQFTDPMVRGPDQEMTVQVRVVPRKEVEHIPYHQVLLSGQEGYSKYQTRLPSMWNHIQHINHNFPQGQRIKGYHLQWSEDHTSCHLYWQGKNKRIG